MAVIETHPLAARLAARISRFGPMTIADFMAEALTHPRHGYYMRGDPFGRGGDFVTAPEISQMFGELIGLWCADTWQRMGAPEPVLLVELGPGRGTLMADALRAAATVPAFAAALRLHFVEVSPALREAQAAALAPHRPQWHDSLESVPDGPLLLIANEFFDALPIRQFVRQDRTWFERVVTLDQDGATLVFGLVPAAPGMESLVAPELAAGAQDALIEVSVPSRVLAEDIGRRIAAFGGAGLIIDYGHETARAGVTLQAVRGHARHDPLVDPGSTDLTAHVDFAALARAARTGGAETFGPVTQGTLLRALGIEARASILRAGARSGQAAAIDAALERLVAPHAMGDLFKALAVTAPGTSAPAGFAGLTEPQGSH